VPGDNGGVAVRFSGRLRAVFQALFVTFLWSTSWVLIKYSIHEIPPLTFAALRYTTAAVILVPRLSQHRDALRALTVKDWGRLAALGLVFYALTQGGQFLTLKYLEATTFSLLMNFSTVVVAVFAIIVLREMPRPVQWAGIVIFIAGALVYFSPSTSLRGQPVGF
jgi:drug/metabolite transporter (DMT)-like permease